MARPKTVGEPWKELGESKTTFYRRKRAGGAPAVEKRGGARPNSGQKPKAAILSPVPATGAAPEPPVLTGTPREVAEQALHGMAAGTIPATSGRVAAARALHEIAIRNGDPAATPTGKKEAENRAAESAGATTGWGDDLRPRAVDS